MAALVPVPQRKFESRPPGPIPHGSDAGWRPNARINFYNSMNNQHLELTFQKRQLSCSPATGTSEPANAFGGGTPSFRSARTEKAAP
jgi:hypothetical protein